MGLQLSPEPLDLYYPTATPPCHACKSVPSMRTTEVITSDKRWWGSHLCLPSYVQYSFHSLDWKRKRVDREKGGMWWGGKCNPGNAFWRVRTL